MLHPEVFAALSVYADGEGETLSVVAEVALARYLLARGQVFRVPLSMEAIEK